MSDTVTYPPMPDVDIHHASGINFRADACLAIAAEAGLEAEVAYLLAFTVYGPTYDRGVHDYLRSALRSIHHHNDAEAAGRSIAEAYRWLATQHARRMA